MPAGERLEPRFGKLGREYPRVVFDKALLPTDPALDWVTPGHPLFEAVRDEVATEVEDDLRRGAVFHDLQAKAPARLDVYCASIQDGRGNTINRRLFVAETCADGTIAIRQPTYFHEFAPAPKGTPVPDDRGLPDRAAVEHALVERALAPFLAEVAAERSREVRTIEEHLRISMEELIHRANCSLGELIERRENDPATSGIEGNIAQAEARLDELNNRYDGRRAELGKERQCAIGEIRHMGRAWVLPHPERGSPGVAPMIQDEEIERIAIRAASAYEEARGWKVEDVQKENRGFDLISRKPHPHDEKTFTDVRFIEVKGRATIGDVALSTNEYKTAERLKADYWLYEGFDCAKIPAIHVLRDPAQLDWIKVVRVEHYQVAARAIQANALKDVP